LVAERITRELDGTVKVRGRIARIGRPRQVQPGGTRAGDNIQFRQRRFDCLFGAAGFIQWSVVRLEGRVLSAEIEHSRSQYLGD